MRVREIYVRATDLLVLPALRTGTGTGTGAHTATGTGTGPRSGLGPVRVYRILIDI